MEMASSGELQTFKQDDQDMFRVEQINMLAEDDDLGDLSISLEDSASDADPLGLSGSSPAMELDDSVGGIDLEASSAGDADSSGIGLEDSAAAAEDSFLGGSSVSARGRVGRRGPHLEGKEDEHRRAVREDVVHEERGSHGVGYHEHRHEDGDAHVVATSHLQGHVQLR